jgi:hypothetical protein
MQMNKPFVKATTFVSAFLLNLVVATAHAQSIGQLVFTESSSTVLTETLNGAAIGDWVYQSPWYAEPPVNAYWLETSGFGGITSPLVNPLEPVIDFADPLHPGSFFDFWFTPNVRAYSDVPVADEEWPTLPGPTATDYLPYSVSSAVVSTPGGFIPVDITFNGPPAGVPDASFTLGLLVVGFAAIALAKGHCFKAEEQAL